MTPKILKATEELFRSLYAHDVLNIARTYNECFGRCSLAMAALDNVYAKYAATQERNS